MAPAVRKLIDILNLTTDYFAEKQIENPRLNAEILIGHALNLSRFDLYLNFEKPVSDAELNSIREFMRRRTQYEPLQYITGEAEFFSLKFKVDRNVLIPRPETEVLVENVINKYSNSEHDSISVLDIGTGCGCIAVALARHLNRVKIFAVDIDQHSIDLATENAILNKVDDRIHFRLANIHSPEFPSIFSDQFTIIISNPPYIRQHDLSNLPPEIQKYEPMTALDGGEDGLRFYYRIAEVSATRLQNRGLLAVEIGMGQENAVKNILQSNQFEDIEIVNDLNGIKRVVAARWMQKN